MDVHVEENTCVVILELKKRQRVGRVPLGTQSSLFCEFVPFSTTSDFGINEKEGLGFQPLPIDMSYLS